MYTVGEENVSPFADVQPVLGKSSGRDVLLHWQLPYLQMVLVANNVVVF